MRLMLIAALLVGIWLPSRQTPPGYRGIVPLQSTRADVERLLGKPKDPQQSTYYFPDEIVSIQYAKYGCSPPPTVEGWPTPPLEGWNVPPDTVLVVRVNLRKQVPLKSLGLELTRFKKIRGDEDVPSHYQYVDEEVGLIVDLNGDAAAEIVRGFIYKAEAKYKYLRCPEQTQ